MPIRGAFWRGIHATLAVLLGGVVAGLVGTALPLSARGVPDLGLAGSEDTGAVITAFLRALASRPEVVGVALVLGLLSALLPAASRRGPWPVAALATVSLAVLLLPSAAVSAVPLVAGIWLCCAVFAVRDRRTAR
jgi:hypothetical protein